MRAWTAGLALLAAIAPAQAEPDWISFKSPDGAFIVDLPRAPVITTERIQVSTSETVPQTKYTIDETTLALMIIDADFSGSQSTIDVDNAVRGMQSGGRVLKSQSVVQLDGHEGRYVTLTDQNGYQLGDMAFIIGRHFYQAVTVLAKDATPAQAAETGHFAASFHFPAH